MASTRDEMTSHCVELLSPLGQVRTRRMFGGVGFYLDEVFVAIIARGRLYLKVDAQTRPQFEAAGCEPFVFDTASKAVALGYFSAPEEAMESPPLMQNWARLALAAALRARSAKPPSAPRRAAAAAPAPVAKPRKPAARPPTTKAGRRNG